MRKAEACHLNVLLSARSRTLGPQKRMPGRAALENPKRAASASHTTRDIAQVTAPGATAIMIAAVSSRPNRPNRSTRSSMLLSIPVAPRPSCEPVHSRPKKKPPTLGAAAPHDPADGGQEYRAHDRLGRKNVAS